MAIHDGTNKYQRHSSRRSPRSFNTSRGKVEDRQIEPYRVESEPRYLGSGERFSAPDDRSDPSHIFEEETRLGYMTDEYRDFELSMAPHGGPEGLESGWSGGQRGRGPKGYQRPPERIREDVCELLTEDDDIDPSDVEVVVEGAVVFLSGTVENRAAKRRCEDLAYDAAGVREVVNHLRIRSEGPESEVEVRDLSRRSA